MNASWHVGVQVLQAVGVVHDHTSQLPTVGCKEVHVLPTIVLVVAWPPLLGAAGVAGGVLVDKD